MFSTNARVETMHGRKYLVQLCKHFAHEVDAKHSGDHGEIVFSSIGVILDSDHGGLNIEITASNEEKLRLGKSILEEHVMRFAFREKLGNFVWST